MVNKLKDLYDYIDINYDRVELYYKNCLEIGDWYYRQLVEIYIQNSNLPITTQTEECHGTQILTYFTDESIEKIDQFENQLKKLINDKFNYTYNSNNLIN